MSNKIEIDIIALLRAIKDNKLWMGVTMGIFGIIGRICFNASRRFAAVQPATVGALYMLHFGSR